MVRQYLLIIWQWMSTAFIKMLVVWCVAALISFLWSRWSRPKKMPSQEVVFPAPKREGLLSLGVMLGLLVLLFILQLIRLPEEAPFLSKGAVLTGTLLLLCFPVVVVLRLRRQGWETVGLARANLTTMLLLGVVLAFVTLLFFAALSALSQHTTLAPTRPVTPQRLLYLITSFTLSALAHEFIYRGYLQTRLSAWGGTTRGLLASALIYALWHWPKFVQVGFNGITMLVQFVALFALGLALGSIYRSTRSIIPAALFHASNDLAQTLWSLA